MKTKAQYKYLLTFLLAFLFFHEQMAQEQKTKSINEILSLDDDSIQNAIDNNFRLLEFPPELKASEATNKEWWKLFGYEKLDSLVGLALTENHAIKMQESQEGIAEEEIKIAKAAKLPSVSLNPTFNRQGFSGNRPMPFDGPVEKVTYNSYAVPLDVAYEVDIYGRAKNNIEASQFNLEASSAQSEATKLNIASDISRYYFMLLMLDSEQKILRETIKSREENLEIVKIRFEAGLTNEIDLHRAKTELSSVTVQIRNLEIERNDIEQTLAAITGQPTENFSLEKVGIKYAAPPIAASYTEQIDKIRPDLLAAGYAVEANKSRLKAARKNLYPSLFLVGSAGVLAGESEQVFKNDSRQWFLGATYSIPIFEGGRRRAQLNISEHRLERSISYVNQQALVAEKETRQEIYALEKLNQQIAAQQEFLLAARRAAKLSQQRYLRGLVTYLEVVDAERIVLEAERLSIQLIGKQLLSTVDLLVAVGGDLSMVE